METLKKIPWLWIVTILWLLGSQIATFDLVILPVLFSFFLAIFSPPVLIVSAAIIGIPALLSVAAWIVLLFKKRLIASILSGLALSVGLFADWVISTIPSPSP